MLFRDMELFLTRVAVDLDNLHSVPERSGNAAEVVRRCDEHDIRQIKGNVDIVVYKFIVLLDIQNLEKRRGGVSLIVARELVHLVKNQNGIVGAGVLNG